MAEREHATAKVTAWLDVRAPLRGAATCGAGATISASGPVRTMLEPLFLRVARHSGCRLTRRWVPRSSLNASRAFRGVFRCLPSMLLL